MATTRSTKPPTPYFDSQPEDHEESTPTSRYTFTPCTRMSNLTLASGSTENGRTRYFARNQRPVMDFNTKLKRAFEDEDTQSHPNLSMVVGKEKISFDRFEKDMHHSGLIFHSDEDESEEDEEELLRMYSSPEQSPSSSPERFTLDSIFDMNVKLPTPTGFGERSMDILEQDNHDEHYDPTFSWVNQIYQDSENDDDMLNESFYNDNKPLEDNENRPPTDFSESSKRGKTRSWACSNSSPASSSSPESRRAPLQELPLDETDDDLHPRKKVILNKKSSASIDYREPLPSPSTSRTRKPFMRALSPSSRKGKEPAIN
ncbi:hypothetical protein BJV82DRAFT_716914 [Fennellomyces sp. T-0311]|nr:hypothetical protein BJV82DRAFT_716914 [Fennellomyces sp. T-0311]